MELREYILILRKNLKLFLIIVLIFLMAGVVYKLAMPTNYASSLVLNVTRAGIEKTDQYKFDSFYRLQADEKFAETVVKWLQSPRVVADILDEAKISSSLFSLRQLSKFFKASRQSSQVVKINYTAQNVDSGKAIAEAVKKILNRETAALNKEQKSENWFILIGDEPVIRSGGWSWLKVLSFSLILGIFAAFFVVLTQHYLKTDPASEETHG